MSFSYECFHPFTGSHNVSHLCCSSYCSSGIEREIKYYLCFPGSLYTWGSSWLTKGFSDGSDSKESACRVGDLGLIPWSWKCPGEGNGYPLQYSCLENPMGRGAWLATVLGVPNSWTWLSTNTFICIFLTD